MAIAWRHWPGGKAGSAVLGDCPETIKATVRNTRKVWRHPDVVGVLHVTPPVVRITCSCKPTIIDTDRETR